MASRTDILDYVKTLLRTIKIGSSVTVRGTSYSFATDIGSAVNVWRQTDIEKGEQFSLQIKDSTGRPVDDDMGEFGLVKRQLEIPIEVIGRGKDYGSYWANQVLTDLYCLIESDYRLGGNCRIARLEEDQKEKETQEKATTTVNLTLVVIYAPSPGEA
mgnify:CR=1 FL=1